MHCPRCRSIELHRIHRRWWERLVPGTRRWQCSSCSARFTTLLRARTGYVA